MAEEASKSPKPEQETPPKQTLGDTPVAPWKMPSPKEKAAVEPVRKALRDALSEVDSPEKADEAVRALERNVEGEKVAEVEKQPAPGTLHAAAQEVTQAAEAAPDGNKAANVLAETARVATKAKGRESEAIAQAAQEVLNPEQQGAPTTGEVQQREYLRQAILKRLKPMDALDAMLFLRINHLPHNRFLNRFFYFITRIFSLGAVWVGLLQLEKLRNPPLAKRALRETTVPLMLATLMVEYPLKLFFKRRRPFIADVRAIAVGIKPSSWSFPSGHAAAAFAGAWLLTRFFPKQRGLLYVFASLGAFSRVYLGDHYPGDVISGSFFGLLFARLFLFLVKLIRRRK